MIVLDILHNIFEILPELILGAGPFCVFKGMGTGKDSGKLLFKKLYTDGGLSITEDGTTLDFTSTGAGNLAVERRKIAFGDAFGGLTSSIFAVEGFTSSGTFILDNVVCLSIIGGTQNCNRSWNDFSLVVAGVCNYIGSAGENSIIAGGKCNQIPATGELNSIISGYCNKMLNKPLYNSVIITGSKNSIYKSCNSAIISSFKTKICCSDNTLARGRCNYINNSCESSTWGLRSCIVSSKTSTISGRNNSGTNVQTSTILNGNGSCIGPSSTKSSSILNGECGCILQGNHNSILNGFCNKIYAQFCIDNSTIINGYCNIIYAINDKPPGSKRNTIFNGKCNRIEGRILNDTVIFNGYKAVSYEGDTTNCANRIIFNGRFSGFTQSCGSFFSGKDVKSYENSVIFSTECVINQSRDSLVITSGWPIMRNDSKIVFNCSQTLLQQSGFADVNSGVASISNLAIGNFGNGVLFNSGAFFLGTISTVYRYLYQDPNITTFIIEGLTVSSYVLNKLVNNTIITIFPGYDSNLCQNTIGSTTASLWEADRRVSTEYFYTICDPVDDIDNEAWWIGNLPNRDRSTGVFGQINTLDSRVGSTIHCFCNNLIVSQESSMCRVCSLENYGDQSCASKRCENNVVKGNQLLNSAIIGGNLHNMEPSTINSAIIGGCCHRTSQSFNSVIIGGGCNFIDGFTDADLIGIVSFVGFSQSAIIGGYKNCLRSKPGGKNQVIIGGCQNNSNLSDSVAVQNVALYCCLSYYNFNTSTCSPGLSSCIASTINSITVCNGIIINIT